MMTTTAEVTTAVRQVITNPACGVVGLVDELLASASGTGCTLNWRADRIRVRLEGGESEELNDLGVRKSIVRAVLARVAKLCNRESTDSVSPYGGQTELSLSDSKG